MQQLQKGERVAISRDGQVLRFERVTGRLEIAGNLAVHGLPNVPMDVTDPATGAVYRLHAVTDGAGAGSRFQTATPAVPTIEGDVAVDRKTIASVDPVRARSLARGLIEDRYEAAISAAIAWTHPTDGDYFLDPSDRMLMEMQATLAALNASPPVITDAGIMLARAADGERERVVLSKADFIALLAAVYARLRAANVHRGALLANIPTGARADTQAISAYADTERDKGWPA